MAISGHHQQRMFVKLEDTCGWCKLYLQAFCQTALYNGGFMEVCKKAFGVVAVLGNMYSREHFPAFQQMILIIETLGLWLLGEALCFKGIPYLHWNLIKYNLQEAAFSSSWQSLCIHKAADNRTTSRKLRQMWHTECTINSTMQG